MAGSITAIADTICGYPLFFLLIGGGLFLFFYTGMVPLRYFRHALAELRRKQQAGGSNEISSVQALASVVAATVATLPEWLSQ